MNTHTAFGSLTFEDNEKGTNSSSDNRVKILRLKRSTDYNIQIEVTATGIWTIPLDLWMIPEVHRFTHIQ